ncbi:condensation domain-containing protein [Clostridium aminobutyricum]|uniref:Carrier domain-containing protein n=1 Tax=Clostridium aminobutyricum TaxID=33953 RepID=A0A939IJT9_CLOAM|nr:condensation domain-containing protein [Clostridium aminobutyricum]MBN7773938.1 hypothetical protein [Clostridium aminobutyricum]
MMNEMLELFRQICNNRDLKKEDNFFVAGGDSMKAGRIISILQERYQAELSYPDIFTSTTIQEIIDKIKTKDSEIPTVSLAHYAGKKIPLTIQQKEILAHDILYKTNAFKIIASVDIHGEVNEKRLKQSIRDVIESYLLFSTQIQIETDLYNCVAEDKVRFLWRDGDANDQDIQLWLNEVIGIEPDRYKVVFYHKESSLQESRLFIGLHHIWGDESTAKIVLDGIWNRYRAYTGQDYVDRLPPSFAYQQFSILQQNEEKEPYMAFWNKKLAEATNISSLKIMHNEDTGAFQEPEYVELQITEDEGRQLHRMAKECGSSLYSIFLSLYKLLIYEITNKNDVLIGFPIRAGAKSGASTEPGLYVSQSISTTAVDEKESIFHFVKRNQQEIFENIEFSVFPFGYIAEMIDNDKAWKELPHKIHFNYIEEEYEDRVSEDLIVNNLNFLKQQQLSDFELIIGKKDSQFRASFVYKKGKFETGYVQHIRTSFERMLYRFLAFSLEKTIGEFIRKEEEFEYEEFDL